MTITGAQAKTARGLLGWTLKTLEGKTGVTATVIADFEADKRAPTALQLTVIRRVIEAAGVEFTNGPEPRLHMKAPKTPIGDEAALPDIPDDAPYDGAPV